jgi:hypothetical protein
VLGAVFNQIPVPVAVPVPVPNAAGSRCPDGADETSWHLDHSLQQLPGVLYLVEES